MFSTQNTALTSQLEAVSSELNATRVTLSNTRAALDAAQSNHAAVKERYDRICALLRGFDAAGNKDRNVSIRREAVAATASAAQLVMTEEGHAASRKFMYMDGIPKPSESAFLSRFESESKVLLFFLMVVVVLRSLEELAFSLSFCVSTPPITIGCGTTIIAFPRDDQRDKRLALTRASHFLEIALASSRCLVFHAFGSGSSFRARVA